MCKVLVVEYVLVCMLFVVLDAQVVNWLFVWLCVWCVVKVGIGMLDGFVECFFSELRTALCVVWLVLVEFKVVELLFVVVVLFLELGWCSAQSSGCLVEPGCVQLVEVLKAVVCMVFVKKTVEKKAIVRKMFVKGTVKKAMVKKVVKKLFIT